MELKNLLYREIAYKDYLTGFYNLIYLEEHIKDIMSTFRNTEISIFMMDIDGFKEVNDNFGHIVGDHFLRDFSDFVNSCLSNLMCLIFRYGGDEFLIFVDEKFEHAKKAMEKLVEKIRKKEFHLDGERIRVTVSIGGEKFRWDELKDIKEALKILDKKLYKAKEKKDCLYV
jgi:diguanylate cyclase (GGDEF)-like protein